MRSSVAVLALAGLLAACSDSPDPAAEPDPNVVDAGGDASPEPDATSPDASRPDTVEPPRDAGTDTDADNDADTVEPTDGGPADIDDGEDAPPTDVTPPTDVLDVTDPGDTDDALDTTDAEDTFDGDVIAPGDVPEPFTVTDGTRADGILLRWGAVEGAVGYRILRDGAPLEIAPADATEFLDRTARAADGVPRVGGLATEPADGGLLVRWTPVAPLEAPIHEYRVLALFEDADGPPSVRRIGRRAAAQVRYQVRANGGSWIDVDTRTQWLDTNATPGGFTVGPVIVGRGASSAAVPLDLEYLEFNPGPQRTYEVRAWTDDETGETSDPRSARRQLSESDLTFQWTRYTSASGDGPSAPAALASRSALDTGAPADGRAVWYRLRIEGPGGLQATTPDYMGYRAWNGCEESTDFNGLSGPLVTRDAPLMNAGISAFLATHAWTPFTNGDVRAVNPAFAINGAIVTTTNRFPRENFWIEDRDSGLRVWLDSPLPADVVPGQRVSFEITQIRNVSGHVNVSAVRNFRVDSSGHAVNVRQISGNNDLLRYVDRMVRISGKITGSRGTCGGTAVCWEFTHGPSDARRTVEYRTTSNRAVLDGCLTYVGPFSQFPGPVTESLDPVPQIDAFNWDWTDHTD